MKRTLSALMCLLLLLSAAGCASSSPAASTQDSPAEVSAAGENTPAPADPPEPEPEASPEPTPEPTPVSLEILGRSCGSLDETVDLAGMTDEDAAAVAEALRQMPALKSIRIGSGETTPLSWDSISLLHEAAPGAEIDYGFRIHGRPFNLRDESLDLKHVLMDDEGALIKQIADCMVNLKKLDMDSCGISNEAMAKLRDSLPEVEVIWRVNFGRFYSVRTDVEMILASAPEKAGQLIHNNAKNLMYCTKVKYLDLGHNTYLDTIEFVRYMPDLEVAILAMNSVEDFSPLAECPKLEYLELFHTRLHDLRPLSELKNLRYLNIAHNFAIRDISPLHGLTQLKMLWIGKQVPLSPEQIAQMQRCAPDCVINNTANDPTEEGWRDHTAPDGSPGRYSILRRQFGDYTSSAFSFSWNDPDYVSGGTEPAERDAITEFPIIRPT